MESQGCLKVIIVSTGNHKVITTLYDLVSNGSSFGWFVAIIKLRFFSCLLCYAPMPNTQPYCVSIMLIKISIWYEKIKSSFVILQHDCSLQIVL